MALAQAMRRAPSRVLPALRPDSTRFLSTFTPRPLATALPSTSGRGVHYPALALAFGTTFSTVARSDFSTTAVVNPPASGEAASKSTPEIVLYQYTVCPFCSKVRAYLDFHGIPYSVVEVDPLRKTELKKFSDDYRKVPIAVIDGVQVNGSSNIIHHVSSEAVADDKWVTWVDEHLIKLIAPNIYRTPRESLQTFKYIAENSKFSAWERASIKYAGAVAMYLVARKKKTAYGITDERAELGELLKEWTSALSGREFMGGDKPATADLCVYGVLRAIREFDTFDEVVAKNEDFASWYRRVDSQVKQNVHA